MTDRYFVFNEAPAIRPLERKEYGKRQTVPALDEIRATVTFRFVNEVVCRRQNAKKPTAKRLAKETGQSHDYFGDYYRGSQGGKKKPRQFNELAAERCEVIKGRGIAGTKTTWRHGPDRSRLWDAFLVEGHKATSELFDELVLQSAKSSTRDGPRAVYAAYQLRDRLSVVPAALSRWAMKTLAQESFWLALSIATLNAKQAYYYAPANAQDKPRTYSTGLMYDLIAMEKIKFKLEEFGLTSNSITDLLGWPTLAEVMDKQFSRCEVESALEHELALLPKVNGFVPGISPGCRVWSRNEGIERCPNGLTLNARLNELSVRYRIDENWRDQWDSLVAEGNRLIALGGDKLQ